MNHLNLIFGCFKSECPTRKRCYIRNIIQSYPTVSDRLKWWGELCDEDKETIISMTSACERIENENND